ncbi:unnamed protein product, partial [Choristocarpus tenellus]
MSVFQKDHTVRIWTRDPQRAAPSEAVEAFDRGVKEGQAKSGKGPSSGEISNLPHWDQRHSKLGSSEGQVQVFQRDGKAIAAQWSAASSVWIEVGEVIGSSDGGQVDGQTYDHVFPIEIEGVTGEV